MTTLPNRKSIVGGNWKMNLHRDEVDALTADLIERLGGEDAVDVVVFPPFVYLDHVAQKIAAAGASAIRVGAQNVYHEANGAFTGEVSCSQIKDAGATFVLVGHSERRHVIGERDTLINAKLRAALDAGLHVILCVGETLEQREAEQTDDINAAQVHYGLAGVTAQQMALITIAYEPVWAIGTGKTATPEDAQNAHAAIRDTLVRMYGSDVGQSVRIQYGGSVKPSNAEELFDQPDIDGGLIGGAALKGDDFVSIIHAAK